jgi:putative CRISPR-associated protein (TIGR02620 family)
MKFDNMKFDTIITRHLGLFQWLELRDLVASNAVTITHVENPSQVEGKVVAGILPLHLAAKCKRYFQVLMNVPKEKANQELTPEEMDTYGACLTEIKVEEVVSRNYHYDYVVGDAAVAEFVTEMGYTYNRHVERLEAKEAKGARVIGTLPMGLVASTDEYRAVIIPDLPKEMRGKRLNYEQMVEYGAYCMNYEVQFL